MKLGLTWTFRTRTARPPWPWLRKLAKTEIAQIFLRLCRVGLELSPGESCDVAGAGTVSIRSDGCLGERPGSLATGISVGSLSITISEGQRTTCTAGYFASGAFRITEVPETSRWRIDALP